MCETQFIILLFHKSIVYQYLFVYIDTVYSLII